MHPTNTNTSSNTHTLKRKRQRAASFLPPAPPPPLPRHVPPDSINPRSHRQATLKQFAVAGLAQDQPRPQRLVRDFPHRGLPPSDDDEEEDPEEEDVEDVDEEDGQRGEEEEEGEARSENPSAASASASAPAARWRRRAHERTAGVLAAAVRRALAAGDVDRAARAFGLLARARVRGRRVDLRHDGYWALGAEVLMRRVDDASLSSGSVSGVVAEGDEGMQKEAVSRVRAYLEALAQTHPYNRAFPGATSALDFYPALFAFETEAAYRACRRAMARVAAAEAEAEAEGWDSYHHDDDGLDVDMDVDREAEADRNRLRRASLNRARRAALERLRDVARRMDALMEGLPYSADHEMLRLRGMVALYMGDLCLVPRSSRRNDDDDDDEDDEDGRREREARRVEARKMFRKIVAGGGELDDPWIKDFARLSSDEDDDGEEEQEQEQDDHDSRSREAPPLLFSSLPMR